MRVDVWSDLVCPWCAIGQEHLETALAGFEFADEVQVVWRSFELDPGVPAVRDGAYDALLAAKYGASSAGGRAMVVRLSSTAERAGVQARFDLPGRRTPSTRTACCTSRRSRGCSGPFTDGSSVASSPRARCSAITGR